MDGRTKLSSTKLLHYFKEKKMKKSLLATFLLVSFMSLPVFAARYGTAGCGLGSLIFKKQKGMVQIFASTTNGTFGNQTFGITSGTSNCRGGSGKAPTYFIEANKQALATEIAKGNGETMDSLLVMYGCEEKTGINKALQKNHGAIFSDANESAEQINDAILNILERNAKGQCDLVA